MAKIVILTREEADERRRVLEAQLGSAKADYADAALKLELGKANSDDLARAKLAVEEIEARLTGLEAARGLASNQEADRRRSQRIADRAAAYARMGELTEARLEPMARIEAAAEAMVQAVADYHAINVEMANIVQGWHTQFQPDQYTLAAEAISSFPWPSFAIVGLLERAGIRLDRIDPDAARLEIARVNVAEYTRDLNRKVMDRARFIDPVTNPER